MTTTVDARRDADVDREIVRLKRRYVDGACTLEEMECAVGTVLRDRFTQEFLLGMLIRVPEALKQCPEHWQSLSVSGECGR